MTSHTENKGNKNWSLSIAIDHTVITELQGSTNVYVGNGWALSLCKIKGIRRNFKNIKDIKYTKFLPDEALRNAKRFSSELGKGQVIRSFLSLML